MQMDDGNFYTYSLTSSNIFIDVLLDMFFYLLAAPLRIMSLLFMVMCCLSEKAEETGASMLGEEN